MMKTLAAGLTLALLALTSNASAEDAKRWRGEPKLQIGKQIAAGGWQDAKGGLHLRVTTPVRKGKAYRIAGTVCALDKKGSNKITSLKGVLLEKGQDSAKVGPKGHCVWFTFKTNGHVDGFDFTTPARHLAFTIRIDGKKMATKQIHIGKAGNHPKSNPAVLKR